MNSKLVKSAIFLVILIIIGVFIYFDFSSYLSFEYLKSQQDIFKQHYANNASGTLLAYFIIYVTLTALSLPGAAVLTLAGGLLFGLTTGTLIVSFSSTAGATLAFLASRFFLKDYVQNKFSEKLKSINEGFEKEGAFYLFSLRLIPVFPFFMINLVMGLFPLKTWQFFFVSQIGMLPGTIAYVNAGTQLGQIDSLAGVLSPGVLLSFAVLGIIPLVSKKIVSFIRARKLLKPYKKPTSYDYNVVVVGAGSAGLVSSYIAAALKAKVALIEKHKMGGDCLNTGCVPSKALIKSAKVAHMARNAEKYGLSNQELKADFSNIMKRVHKVIEKIEPHDSVKRYSSLGVDCIQGEARIVSPYEVHVDGKALTTRAIIVATGARPFIPPIEGIEKITPLTSDNLWQITQQPNRLIVLGGGPIGCEMAQSFQRLGTQVIQVEMGERIMAREDEDVSKTIQARLKTEGVDLRLGHFADRIEVDADGNKTLICKKGTQDVKIEFDEILVAVGRSANSTGFGLEKLGVEISKRGTITHDAFMATNFPNIFTCGDVAGPWQFTHTAAHQAYYAIVNALFRPFTEFVPPPFNKPLKVDTSAIPWATYTDPEVATVGLTESVAKKEGIEYDITKYGIDDLDRAITEDEDHGFVKVLTTPGSDRILGATIVSSRASDMIVEFISAMKQGHGLNSILGTIHIYPTMAEANKFAAGVWKRGNTPQGALKKLEAFFKWRRS